MAVKSQQDIVKFNKSYPIATKFISQFTNWAKVWMSAHNDSKIPRKRKNTSTSRETDIRSRTNYYDQPQAENISMSQRTILYRATCQKLRPSNNSRRKLVHLGDILHVRNFWDHLETIVYQDLTKSSHYLPPSKRLPFNADKPGSIYLPRKQKKSTSYTSDSLPKKRQSFASSTIVYSNQGKKNVIQVLPVVVPPEDDDDVPLGSLHFSNSKASPHR